VPGEKVGGNTEAGKGEDVVADVVADVDVGLESFPVTGSGSVGERRKRY
jgi:hypothetical protein